MRVMVTGAAGYIGPVVVRHLKEAGHTVLGYDLEWFAPDTESQFRVRADIRDAIVAPDWPDVVVHLAGLSNDPMGDLDPRLTDAINVEGTWAVGERHWLARHVVISSCAVYGATDKMATEETEPNPQSAYAEAKATVDEWAAAGRNVISLRLGTVFGPATNHRLDLVVNRMVYDAVKTGMVTATGNAARPFIHVEDVARAVLWAVEGDATGIYNVVADQYRMRHLAMDIATALQVRHAFREAGADTRDYMASGEKLLKAGWHPTKTILGSVQTMANHAATLGDDPAAYTRLAQLKALDPIELRKVAA